VSIVTPSYNQAQFLEETIRSVLLQGYPDLEYFVMDGGSTDSSVHIIQKYAQLLAYWVSEKDRGQSHAINKGWQRATGEIWAYLNSDDMLTPNAVSIVVDTFRAHPDTCIVHGDWLWVDANGTEISYGKGAPCDFQRLLRGEQIWYVAQPASFYRAELVRQVGLLDESLELSMDYDLLLRLAQVGKMVYVPHPLARFTLHPSTKTTAFTERHWQETLRVQARYSGRWLVTPRLKYLRYRLFRALPLSLQMFFRRKRRSMRDWVFMQPGSRQ